MTLFIEGHAFGYELQRVVQGFCFGERVVVEHGAPPRDFSGAYLHTLTEGNRLCVTARLLHSADSRCAQGDDFNLEEPIVSSIHETAEPDAQEHTFGVMLYRMLSQATGLYPQWGVLTGIRPVKLFLGKLAEGMEEAALRAHFQGERLVSEARFALALRTARVEQPLLQKNTPDSFSLYVSIPFCPTRCAYCSFVSHTVEKAARLIPDYVEMLCCELRETAAIAHSLGLRLRTVYFGGGTPTTLTAVQLARVMEEIERSFAPSGLWEYTVEAGRPDTIDQEKLTVIKRAGADRISINPQTLSDEVLAAIGRRHSADEVREAFALARVCGFSNINMDLIAGLPTDTPEGFAASVEGVLALAPENVTVHTLTVKRAARLTFEAARRELSSVGGMVDFARERLEGAGLAPYYLYRQTGSLSGLENVGYARPGSEGLYNICIMDETHTILAVGAGGSTKLRHPQSGAIERIYNYKYPYEYLSRFDQLLERKKRIAQFYDGL